jgi:hypothetical protein
MNALPPVAVLRWSLWTGLVALLATPLFAAPTKSDAPAADAAPIELPKFVVTDSRILPPPEQWRYAAFPGFEVLTNATDRSTQRLVREFRMFQTAVSTIWPIALPKSAVPTTLILCGRRNAFDAFMPAGDQRPDRGMASLFLTNKEESAIIIDLQASVINLATLDSTDTSTPAPTDDGSASAPGFATEFRVDHYRQLQREYIHFLIGRSEPRPPAWLEEGLAQMFMAMQFDRKSITFAKVDDPNKVSIEAANAADQAAADAAAGVSFQSSPTGTPQEDRDFNAVLATGHIMGLQQMFDVKSDSDVARNPLGSRWAKQCYAFVHYCLYSNDAKQLQRPFFAFVDRTMKEAPTEDIFKECFKMSYNEMAVRLRGYSQFTAYNYQEFTAKKGQSMPDPEPLELRDATESEVGRIKGEALIIAGHAETARLALIAPYIRGERDPQLLACLGMYERTAGHDDRARKFLEAAAKANIVRPRAYLELARLRYAEALAAPAGANGRFDADQLAGILRPLFTARMQPPSMSEVYQLIATAWTQSAVPPTNDQIAVLGEGIRIFPRNSELVYRSAALCVQLSRNDTARDLIDLGLKFSRDAATRDRFTQLQAKLPPAPPPVAPPAPASTPAK